MLRGGRDRHAVRVSELGLWTVPLGDDGVVVGVDADGRPAVLGVHRADPYEVTLIGGLWTAQVLAVRVVGTGARVVVETGRAAAWTTLAQAVGGDPPGLTLHGPGRVPEQRPSAHGPVLVVRDCGTRPPRRRVAAAPWQCVLTLLPCLGPEDRWLPARSSVTGVQRVSPEEAGRLARLLHLPAEVAAALPTLADGVTLWCTRREQRLVATEGTEMEMGLLGVPRRVDPTY
ncbi:hypothetical protein LG634_34835 [Streptomyces bambusae]|nr:hypothetical protein [Streptomyces bambusae]